MDGWIDEWVKCNCINTCISILSIYNLINNYTLSDNKKFRNKPKLGD